jgi:hypothetical protein
MYSCPDAAQYKFPLCADVLLIDLAKHLAKFTYKKLYNSEIWLSTDT